MYFQVSIDRTCLWLALLRALCNTLVFFVMLPAWLVLCTDEYICVCCDIIDSFKQDANRSVPEGRVIPEKQCELVVILQ